MSKERPFDCTVYDVKKVRRLRTQRRRVIAAGCAGVVLAIVITFLIFQHRPAWYRPALADEPTIQAAREETAAIAARISDRLVLGESVNVELHDAAVNRWLAARPVLWPDARWTLPDEVAFPALSFDDGLLRVAALFERNGWRAILSADFTVTIDGDSLRVMLTNIRGGSLPLPRFVVRPALSRSISRSGATPEREFAPNAAADPIDAVWRTIRSPDDLFRGISIENNFIWPNGRRRFRIASIRIDDGAIHLRLEPR